MFRGILGNSQGTSRFTFLPDSGSPTLTYCGWWLLSALHQPRWEILAPFLDFILKTPIPVQLLQKFVAAGQTGRCYTTDKQKPCSGYQTLIPFVKFFGLLTLGISWYLSSAAPQPCSVFFLTLPSFLCFRPSPISCAKFIIFVRFSHFSNSHSSLTQAAWYTLFQDGYVSQDIKVPAITVIYLFYHTLENYFI